MATVVLQVVGAAIGGAIGGPVGATIGRAVGAAAGYAIDQQVFSKDQVIKGGRLETTRFLASTEGTPIPKAYGRVRLGGQLIWSTRFEERKKKKKSGGKGGPSVTTTNYRYFANFAVGICEGPISHFGRIWADGKEIDQTRFTIRYYKGNEEQTPDPLIEALQGDGKTPAFKGTAYVVFEDFPLADFGNRIPQLSFEVIRSISEVDRSIRSVTIIPGATEFGYSPIHLKSGHKGKTVSENRHVLVSDSDWSASFDELQALCPNLESIALVVTWFGTDLRAGDCRIEPKCLHRDLSRPDWTVSGLTRVSANLVSEIDGVPAFGGTPSDKSVIAAIADLKARGLKVMFYPFIMMDIPAGNALPDPYGSSGQAAFPWRGRITCHPAPDLAGSADQSAIARTQVNALVGTASASDFSMTAATVSYSGPDEFSYRRMVLHYAHLCEAAGSVDRFLIGSELPGLTRVRDEVNAFPFVDALVALAADVRQILGSETRISYAADWSEYFGYHPQGADNDLYFNLDPLWASDDIDAVAIDNYMPVSDWHEAGDPGDPQARSRFALDYLKTNIAGGEGRDWYYPDASARKDGNRTAITDGMGEAWVWGFKALDQWWQNPHHQRIAGEREMTPTAWVPSSKPVWFTEIGCPAIDRGANQPNLFIDAKSSESALPWFSKSGRDDLMQLRYLQAQFEFWSDTQNQFNPTSQTTGEPMLSVSDIFVWAWDARPYPAFPLMADVWSDGENWYRGHWINGRLGSCPLDELIRQILLDHGHDVPQVDVDGHVEGYVVSGETSPRAALEPLLASHQLTIGQSGEKLVILGKDQAEPVTINPDDLVQEGDETRIALASESETELARQLSLSHAMVQNDFETTTTASTRLETHSERQITMELPVVMPREKALALTNARLRDHWAGRHSARLALPQKYLALEPSDTFFLQGREYQTVSITSGVHRETELRGFSRFDEAGTWIAGENSIAILTDPDGQPFALLMNLPLGQDAMNPVPRLYCAALQNPWNQQLALFASPGTSGFEQVATISEPALIAETINPFNWGPSGRWDNGNELLIRVLSENGEFQSVERELVLAGSNAIAVENSNGHWEIVQFTHTELIDNDEWKLSGLLRGQLGSEVLPENNVPSGASIVFLDDALIPIEIPAAQTGLPLNWRIGPVDQNYASEDYLQLTATCLHVSNRPMRPVHLRAFKQSGFFRFEWIRRSRVNSDNWEVVEVPLDYAVERYAVRFVNASGIIVREATVAEPTVTYSDNDRVADHSDLTVGFSVEVAQLDNSGSPGPFARISVQP